MRWVTSEYILKGIFLGLLLFVALQNLDWAATGRVALYMVGGLAAALILAALRQARDMGRFFRKPLGYILFLLLENPLLIYAGLMLGLGYGAVTERDPNQATIILSYCFLGGAVVGYGLGELREIRNGMYRFVLTLAVGAGLIAGIFFWLQEGDFLSSLEKRQMLGVHLLLGIPFFYLLTFAGMAEESEVEIAALCATVGLGIWLLQFPKNMPALGFLLPFLLYFFYSIRVLNPLRVFKHSLRGYSYFEMGRVRPALMAFNRAMQLDPRNQTARQGLIRIHRGIHVEKLDQDTIQLLNPNLCLQQASNLLIHSGKPTETQLAESAKLLDLVQKQWPHLRPQTDYYRIIAATHARQLDEASEKLSNLLDTTVWKPDDVSRSKILFDAWQLALRTHPELKRRVGDVQLNLPGRRLEGIAAVERQLAKLPNDPVILEFRDEFYENLNEEEYFEAALVRPPLDFGYGYVESQGLKRLNDPEQWRRGAAFLRIAGNGQPERGPGIFQKLAEVYENAGESAEALRYRTQVRDSALKVGVTALTPDQKAIYFNVLKRLADDAAARGDYEEAIYNYSLYTQFEGSGKETLRTLADMYEKAANPLQALRVTEKAIVYGSDADLVARKDKYYYSVQPEDLRGKTDEVRSYFDVKYCVNKAQQLLEGRNNDLEILDWAQHLAKLALVMEPKNLRAQFLAGRTHLRRGEREEGLRYLEDVREMTPSGTEESDAWYATHRQLGKIYLDELGRADLAVECFKKFQESLKSGADTMFDLARCYEVLGDRARAINNYEQVTSFEQHPLRWEAEAALQRLKGEGAT